MTIKEVRMRGVDIACLHCNHVRDKLVSRIHTALEEVDDDDVKSVLELGIAFECCLKSASFGWDDSQSSPKVGSVSV